MSATTLNTARPDWYPGQVTVNSQSDFRIVLEGKATNGGFAVDQLVFNKGKATLDIRLIILSFYSNCIVLFISKVYRKSKET